MKFTELSDFPIQADNKIKIKKAKNRINTWVLPEG